MRNRKVIGVVVAAVTVCCVSLLFLGLANDFFRNTLGMLPTYTPKPTKTQTSSPTDTPIFTLTSITAPSKTPEPPPTGTPFPTTPSPDILSCIPLDTKVELGTVTRVIDGDTIEVQIEGVTYPVRYIGMDTPEYNEPNGDLASEENSKLVLGKTVTLVKDVSETDPYDRLLRYVIVDGVFVNHEMVRLGYAEAVEYPPDTSCQEAFHKAEQAARSVAAGLWGIAGIETPTPPSAQTPSNVVISFILYDGDVPQVESDEYAEISNTGSEAINIGGWRLNAGNPGQDYYFPDFTLESGQSCRVYTNEVHPDTCGFCFFSPQPVWNNKGDFGYLYNSEGVQVDEYRY